MSIKKVDPIYLCDGMDDKHINNCKANGQGSSKQGWYKLTAEGKEYHFCCLKCLYSYIQNQFGNLDKAQVIITISRLYLENIDAPE